MGVRLLFFGPLQNLEFDPVETGGPGCSEHTERDQGFSGGERDVEVLMFLLPASRSGEGANETDLNAISILIQELDDHGWFFVLGPSRFDVGGRDPATKSNLANRSAIQGKTLKKQGGSMRDRILEDDKLVSVGRGLL